MTTAVNGARRTFFSGAEAGLRWLANHWNNGLLRLDAWADWCGERAR